MTYDDQLPPERDENGTTDDTGPVKKLGVAKKWKAPDANKAKLIQSIAFDIFRNPKSVEDAFRDHPLKSGIRPCPGSSVLASIIYGSKRGVSKDLFVDTIDALADVFPEVFSGKTYGDVAENAAILEEMANKPIDSRLPAEEFNQISLATENPASHQNSPDAAASGGFPGIPPMVLVDLNGAGYRGLQRDYAASPTHHRLYRTMMWLAPIAIAAAWLVVIAWEEYRVQQLQDLLTNQIVKSQRLEASLASEKENNRPASLATLSSHVATFDPQIFYGSQNSIYEIGRIIPNNTSLYNDTNFVKDLEETIYSFDMFANTGGVVKERWMPILEDGLRRGVDYRIVLSDYRPENENFARFSHAVGEALTDQARGATIENHRQLQALIDRLEADKQKGDKQEFRGSLTVKWNDDLLLHTLWLRDGKQPRAIGHLGVHFYQGKGQWPCIRASKQTSPEMVENMVAEFETIWDRAKDYDFLPYLPVSSEPVRLLKPVAE